MVLKLLILTKLVGLSSSACPSSKDQEIKGLCFTFMPYQLTYNASRNYCHHNNPVGFSNLAYVPDKETSNYLAVYAHSAFGSAAENFWIGLSRDPVSKSLSWDNGFPVTYTNFGSHVGKNYFSEKISNAKWDTLGDNDKSYFVCSYDPAVKSTTQSVTKTTTTPDSSNCQVGGPQTVLFAYSNDLNPFIVMDTLQRSSLDSQNVSFAISRFDLPQPEDIAYFTTYNQAMSYVSLHKPNVSLGFNDTTRGSNVLDVIDMFYNNTQTPCGSFVIVLSKRYPNTLDISNIVAKVRQRHGMVNFLASNTPSGGTQSRVLYDLSSQTNGVYAITRDTSFSSTIDYIPTRERYPIYAVTPRVSGEGSQILPPMTVLVHASYLLSLSIQSHVPTNNVKDVELYWRNPSSTNTGYFGMPVASWGFFDFNSDGTHANLAADVYNITINYDYTNSDVEVVQVRFYSSS